jgi:hypothetical protein
LLFAVFYEGGAKFGLDILPRLIEYAKIISNRLKAQNKKPKLKTLSHGIPGPGPEVASPDI